MLGDAARRLQAILTELRRLPAVLGATIARRDGILIAHALPKTMDPKKIAAMAAAIVGTHIGKMIATGAGEEAILVTMVRSEANMGLLLLSVDRAVQSISDVLKAAEVPA